MKVQMQVQARAILEWDSTRGLMGLTYRVSDRPDPEFTVNPGSEQDDWLHGSHGDILLQAEALIESKKLGEAFVPHITNVIEQLTAQPLPEVQVSKTDLDLEAQRVRDTRRDWLIREIEEGSYAAIQMLKDEFGETVKISVEVLA